MGGPLAQTGVGWQLTVATVFLHIGAPKTATSTLQAALAADTEALLERGVLYPADLRSGSAHHPLACDLIERHQTHPVGDAWYGGQPRGESFDRLQAELARHGGRVDRVVLSTELLFGQSENIGPMLEDLRGRLREHEVRVVVYLRRQDQWYSSFYNQDVKGLRRWPHDAYKFYQSHQVFQMDYLSLLRCWARVFGRQNILLRPFEPAQWPEGDVLRDFCAATGLPPLHRAAGDGNEGLGFHQLYFKQCLNRAGLSPDLNDEVLAVLVRLYPEEPAKNTLFVNGHVYRRYRERWQRENRQLAEEFLGGRDLFVEPLPERLRPDYFLVDHAELVGLVQRLVAELGEGPHSRHRQLFARAAVIALSEKRLWDDLEAGARETLTAWL